MRKARLFIGLAVLLWGTSTAIGQDRFGFTNCDPCEPLSHPCSGGTGFFSPVTFSGWIETGIYGNSHEHRENGPMHTASRRRTDLTLSQLFLTAEKEMDTRRGFDWGAKTDFVYGSHASSMQTKDGRFDDGWGKNKHGYAVSVYRVYGTLGYKDLSVKIGKFSTPIGWEASASKGNFFYSHSYCYWIEPSTHMGALATYNMTNRLTLNAGWTTGMNSSFSNPNGNSAVLSGFAYSLADNATVHYWMNVGKQYAGVNAPRNDYFVQSLCFEWVLTKRFTYMLQYNLCNDNVDGVGRFSSYGINNHFLYKLNDRWGVGTRFEWLRDNGGYVVDNAGDYYQVTLGLNWNPRQNVGVRPEIRYDRCKGTTPFAGTTRSDQVSGGCGVVISF